MFDCIIAVNCLEQAGQIRTQLEQGGFPVNVIGAITEWNGLLSIVSEFRIDVLIVEDNLKRMEGIQWLNQALRLQPSCAVIVASSRENFTYDHVSAAIDVGVQGYILLPVEEKHLSRAMGSVIRWLFSHNRDSRRPEGSTPIVEKASEQNSSEDVADGIYHFIFENYVKPLAMADITNQFHISESYVNRLLMKKYGSSFKKILNRIRLEQARHLLRENSKMSIGDIARSVGYTDEYYFYRLYKAYTGVTPSNDRNSD